MRQELDSLERKRSAAANDSVSFQQLDHRIRELQQTIATAAVVDVAPADDVVRFGASVTVRSASDGEESEYRIVGPAEADAGRGLISSISPLARALLNHKVGERVPFKFPAGEDTLEILAVSY